MNTLKKSLLFITACSILLFAGYISDASAQSCADAESLLTCEFVSVENCRAASTCASDREIGLTQQDVTEDAAAMCCGKATANKIQACLKRANRKIRRSRRRAPLFLKSFLREAQVSVRALRTNGCSTGSLGQL